MTFMLFVCELMLFGFLPPVSFESFSIFIKIDLEFNGTIISNVCSVFLKSIFFVPVSFLWVMGFKFELIDRIGAH